MKFLIVFVVAILAVASAGLVAPGVIGIGGPIGIAGVPTAGIIASPALAGVIGGPIIGAPVIGHGLGLGLGGVGVLHG